jgi:hypothetical protein
MNPDYHIAAILIGLAIIATLVALREISAQREKDAVQQREVERFHDRGSRASWSGATIVSVRNCNSKHELKGKSLIDIRLHVLSTDQKSYNTSALWLVDSTALPALKPGQHIPVKIDLEDSRIIYPNMMGMEFIPRKDQCKD